MSDSILTSTKKLLGLSADYTPFDADILAHINSVLSSLAQIGVGPPTGFMVEDATATWSDFLGSDLLMNGAKSYVYAKVRLLFDPPANPAVISALQETAREFEFRLNVTRETTQWTDPTPPVVDQGDDPFVDPVIDGGLLA